MPTGNLMRSGLRAPERWSGRSLPPPAPASKRPASGLAIGTLAEVRRHGSGLAGPGRLGGVAVRRSAQTSPSRWADLPPRSFGRRVRSGAPVFQPRVGVGPEGPTVVPDLLIGSIACPGASEPHVFACPGNDPRAYRTARPSTCRWPIRRQRRCGPPAPTRSTLRRGGGCECGSSACTDRHVARSLTSRRRYRARTAGGARTPSSPRPCPACRPSPDPASQARSSSTCMASRSACSGASTSGGPTAPSPAISCPRSIGWASSSSAPSSAAEATRHGAGRHYRPPCPRPRNLRRQAGRATHGLRPEGDRRQNDEHSHPASDGGSKAPATRPGREPARSPSVSRSCRSTCSSRGGGD